MLLNFQICLAMWSSLKNWPGLQVSMAPAGSYFLTQFGNITLPLIGKAYGPVLQVVVQHQPPLVFVDDTKVCRQPGAEQLSHMPSIEHGESTACAMPTWAAVVHLRRLGCQH
jgi:hypothetical protein